MSNTCIFCNIINKQIPSSFVAENKYAIAINDISPKAPVHYLIILKKHVEDIRAFEAEDVLMGAGVFSLIKELSILIPQPNDFRLIMNNGSGVGQSVFHAHLHMLAGKNYSDF